MEGNFIMSQKEANQLEIFHMLKDNKIKQKKAANMLGITTRQIRRKLIRFRKYGAEGLVHVSRGRVSNNKVDEAEISRAIEIVREKYSDFKPTFAHEKLAKYHEVTFSVERLRQAMIIEGLWKPKKRRKSNYYQMRERRECEGELIQVDGSPHDWFEGRGKIGMCSLLVYIDDATGKLLHLEFAESENTWSYFVSTKKYLQKHGKPLAFYCDKHGVFRVNNTRRGTADTSDSIGTTEFGRAMKELEIELIYAHSPQAKGRVERVNSTLQDRLVKEMRLLGIKSIKEANHYLPKFIRFFNDSFAKEPKSTVNVHRSLLSSDDLTEIFTKQETRVLSKNLTCQYKNKIYQIQTDRPTYAMRRATVIIKEDIHGEITIEYKGKNLKYTIFEKRPKSQITDIKDVNRKIDELRKNVSKPFHPEKSRKISSNHPWKNLPIQQKIAVTNYKKKDISTL